MRFIDLGPLLLKRNRWGNRAELWKNLNLKKDFRDYFHNKCWYTEVILLGQDAPIDHFRPKGKIKPFEDYDYNVPLQNCGYHWLKNEPRNYRLCCIYSNRITGDGGKGCFFPLVNQSPLLTEAGNENEQPLLLDPCKREDVQLVSFMGNRVISSSTDPLNQTRVKVSSTIYNLEDTYIMSERAKIWNEVEKRLEEYQSGNIEKTYCVERLKELISREAQFSACAIACVNSLAPDEIKAELDLSL